MRSLVVASISLVLLSGCSSVTKSFTDINRMLPDGDYKQASAEVTGKFTSTTLDGTGKKKDGKWVRGRLVFKHNDPWITKAEVVLEYDNASEP